MKAPLKARVNISARVDAQLTASLQKRTSGYNDKRMIQDATGTAYMFHVVTRYDGTTGECKLNVDVEPSVFSDYLASH